MVRSCIRWVLASAQQAIRSAHTLEEAERTYHFITEAYRSLCYDLIPLPGAGVAERAESVLDRLQKDGRLRGASLARTPAGA
jgi:predicted ATPase